MTDYFALLGQPRRPWLDAGALREQFLALSSAAHPDRQHSAPETDRTLANQRFAELNAAHACLKEPRDRVRHLLELELGHRPTDLQEVPQELADWFVQMGEVCRKTAALVAERSHLTSPLLLAQFFERIQPHLDTLKMMQQRLRVERENVLQQLGELDARWADGDRSALLHELERVWRLLGFYTRWQSQIQEGFVRLTL